VLATGNPADDGQIIAKSDSGSTTTGWQFKTSPDTGVRTFGVGVSPNGSSIVQRYSKTVPVLNTWYHVAGVYNANARTLDVYVNGMLDDGVLSGTVPSAQFDPNLSVLIGKRNDGYNFIGTIDEVRIYNRALSQTEIQTDMNSAVGSASPADTTAPSVPANAAAAAVGANQVNVSWGASSDNVGVTGYLVERSSGAGSTSFAQVATPAGASFSDTGLAASTVYNYRVRATDAAGNLSGYSAVASATTQAVPDTTAPSVPANVMAAAVSTNQVNVSWSASSDNVGVTGYLVERSSGAGSTSFAQVATPAGASFSDTGLAASTVYNYRVRATDAAGNLSGYSAVASATTQALPDTTAPSVPANMAAAGVSSSQVNVSWSASSDNVGVTGYLVERSQGAGSTSFAQVATPSGTGFGDTGLSAGTVYNYRVRAKDAAGNVSGYSTVASATTQSLPDTTAPSAPANLVATAASSSQINLGWSGSTDNVGVTGYLVERSQGAGSTSFAQVGTVGGTSYGDTGLTASTVYNYRVRATDAAGNLSGYSAVASATTQALPDTTAPSVPVNVVAAAASTNQVNVTWSASTDNVGVTGYLVERSQGAGSTSFAQVGTPAAASYSDAGLLAGTVYNYRVRAADAAGNLSGYSAVASTTTSNVVSSGSGPVASYGFSEGSGTVTADSSGNGYTGTLSAATWTSGGKYGQALSFNGTSSYVNLGNPALLKLTGSMTLEAWVLATGNPADDGQIIAKSDSGSTTTGWQFKTSPDTGVRTFGVGVSPNGSSIVQRFSKTVPVLNTWYHVAGVYNASARTLDVYVNGVLDDGVLSGSVPSAQFDPNLSVLIGKRSGGYNFMGTIDEVRIYNRALSQTEIQTDMNTSMGGSSSVDTTAPTAPTGLAAVAVSRSQINLSWGASTDNVGVTGYLVEYRRGYNGNFTQIGTTTGTTFTSTGLFSRTTYSYRVRATDAAGNLSTYSGVVSATTQ